MILIHFTPSGQRRTVDLRDIFWGRTAMLVGGAPSLREQPYKLLEQRGVLTMAMNNAARDFRPTLWSCGDHPDCYEPQLLEDPTIMKFGPMVWAQQPADMHCKGKKFYEFPNIYFYIQKYTPPWDEFFADRAEVPWYQNTLFVSLHLLYLLGIRRVILAGSDFMFGKQSDYAHGQQLGTMEKRWNLDLYNHLVRELRLMKPYFDQHKFTLMDSSKNSRLSQVFPHISLEDAVSLCLEGFPKTMVEPTQLPHCSKFAKLNIKDAIAQWPGHDKGVMQAVDNVSEGLKQQHVIDRGALQQAV